jgi:hypothetical protein
VGLRGDDLLSAPVVEAGATDRAVYLPRGCWQDANTGTRYTGPATPTVAAPLDRLPWFTRCGSDPLAAAACRDRLAPLSRVARASATGSRVTASGRSADRGCGGTVRRVYVSLARVRGHSCWFAGAGGRLARQARSCRRPVLLAARGTGRWRFALTARRLPRGAYRLQVRAVDAAGNKERPRKAASAVLRIR